MNREVYRNGVLIRTEEVPDEPPTADERLAALEEVLAEKQIVTREELDDRGDGPKTRRRQPRG